MLKVLPLKLKGILILSFLFAIMILTASSCTGGGSNQSSSPTNPIPTPTPTVQTFDSWINTLNTVRQTTYDATKHIQCLAYNGILSRDSYNNAFQYYNTNIAAYFNTWLDNLVQEVQNGQTLINATPGDIIAGSLAIVNDEGFIQWEKTVSPTSSQQCQGVISETHQGGYLTALKPMGEFPLLEEFVKWFWEFLKEHASDVNLNLQAIATAVATPIPSPTVDIQNALQQGYQQISSGDNSLTSEIRITQGQGSLIDQLQAARWETWQDVNSLG